MNNNSKTVQSSKNPLHTLVPEDSSFEWCFDYFDDVESVINDYGHVIRQNGETLSFEELSSRRPTKEELNKKYEDCKKQIRRKEVEKAYRAELARRNIKNNKVTNSKSVTVEAEKKVSKSNENPGMVDLFVEITKKMNEIKDIVSDLKAKEKELDMELDQFKDSLHKYRYCFCCLQFETFLDEFLLIRLMGMHNGKEQSYVFFIRPSYYLVNDNPYEYPLTIRIPAIESDLFLQIFIDESYNCCFLYDLLFNILTALKYHHCQADISCYHNGILLPYDHSVLINYLSVTSDEYVYIDVTLKDGKDCSYNKAIYYGTSDIVMDENPMILRFELSNQDNYDIDEIILFIKEFPSIMSIESSLGVYFYFILCCR